MWTKFLVLLSLSACLIEGALGSMETLRQREVVGESERDLRKSSKKSHARGGEKNVDGAPGDVPTMLPTHLPSQAPNYEAPPTMLPTHLPTTSEPTMEPTQPTHLPTHIPSQFPNYVVSFPTPSLSPSLSPFLSLSISPSLCLSVLTPPHHSSARLLFRSTCPTRQPRLPSPSPHRPSR